MRKKSKSSTGVKSHLDALWQPLPDPLGRVAQPSQHEHLVGLVEHENLRERGRRGLEKSCDLDQERCRVRSGVRLIQD